MRSIRVVILAVPLLVHQRLAKKGRLPDIRTTSNKKKEKEKKKEQKPESQT